MPVPRSGLHTSDRSTAPPTTTLSTSIFSLVLGFGTLRDDAPESPASQGSVLINMDGKARGRDDTTRDVPREGLHGPSKVLQLAPAH